MSTTKVKHTGYEREVLEWLGEKTGEDWCAYTRDIDVQLGDRDRRGDDGGRNGNAAGATGAASAHAGLRPGDADDSAGGRA